MIYICENDNDCTIYKAKLHNPTENIVKIATNVNCQRMNGLVYGLKILYSTSTCLKRKIHQIQISRLWVERKKVTDALATLELPVERKIPGCQRKLLKHKENKLWNQSVMVLENFQEEVIETLAIVDSNLWYLLSDRIK